MKAVWVAIGLLGLLLLVVLLFWGLGALVDRLVAARLRKKARRELAHRSEAELLREVDAEIAVLEAKVEQTKMEAAKLAGRFGVMGHTEGPYSRVRDLKRYRAAILHVASERAVTSG